jgi:TIR domain
MSSLGYAGEPCVRGPGATWRALVVERPDDVPTSSRCRSFTATLPTWRGRLEETQPCRYLPQPRRSTDEELSVLRSTISRPSVYGGDRDREDSVSQRFNASAFRQQMRAAQRKAEQELKRAIDKANREAEAHNRKVIADYNRKVEQHNRQVVAEYNRQVEAHNRAADRHNREVVNDLNRRLRSAASRPSVQYTPEERLLADRVQEAISVQDVRDYHVFLSYARIDGSVIATKLRSHLEDLGVSVWFDEVAIHPGKSQALQMDQGLRQARSGVVVLTAAYLAGRFWTERELGALLHKPTLIPVLHGVTFKDVAEYSGILPDLAGFTTDRDSVRVIAEKIAAAVRAPEAA